MKMRWLTFFEGPKDTLGKFWVMSHGNFKYNTEEAESLRRKEKNKLTTDLFV